ncbi:MAG: CDP-alcohol phosphatidyltransferase family protein [Alphaproteobacteria bacterium]|nr:CDP-alcohol phosphatidyltransferase family protein [Alphaproteobacteria bacterium]
MNQFSLFAALPNMISLARLVLVPVVVVFMIQLDWLIAFLLFVVAGISDAVDGYIAKRFNLRSELGAYLDPLADKALLMSIYVTLAIELVIPAAVAILVVSRDVMIMGAVMVSWILDKPVEIKPLFVSKANTAAQIAFAASVLAAKAFGWQLGLWFQIAIVVVAVLTLASAAAYFAQWLKHMTE